jgi:hypothetical protein
MAESASSDQGLQAASDRIRETAKWLTVSLGAVGALLLAGTQLSSVGELVVGSDRFWVAVTGGVLAGLGTVTVLIAAVLVATTPVMNLTRLRSTPAPVGTDAARTDEFLLMGYDGVSSLAADYEKAIAARKKAIDGFTGTATDADTAAQTRAAAIDGTVARLVLVSSHTNLNQRWRTALWPICLGGLVAAVGVVLFVWAANPPDAAKASAVSPGVLREATTGELTLTAAGQDALRESAGCDLDRPVAVLLVGSTDAGADVVLAEEGCQPVRALITETWGAVLAD